LVFYEINIKTENKLKILRYMLENPSQNEYNIQEFKKFAKLFDRILPESTTEDSD